SSCIFGIWLSTAWRTGLSKEKAGIGNAAKAAPASAPLMNSRRLNALWLESVNASPIRRRKIPILRLASDSGFLSRSSYQLVPYRPGIFSNRGGEITPGLSPTRKLSSNGPERDPWRSPRNGLLDNVGISLKT